MVETCPKEPQWLKVDTGIESLETPTGSKKKNGTTQNYCFVSNMYWIQISKWKHTINAVVSCQRLIASLLNKGDWPLPGARRSQLLLLMTSSLRKKEGINWTMLRWISRKIATSNDENDDDDEEEEHLRNAGIIICLPGIVVMSPAGTLF
jgi:hypothetical protein